MFDAPCQCTRCGQSVVADASSHDFAAFVCEPCKLIDRAPQGESMRLFTPAPNQIPGQLSL